MAATIERTTVERGSEGGWFRRRFWSDGAADRLFLFDRFDTSKVYDRPYNPKCSMCWLGFGHTLNAHNQ
jgi:hypothetical protein